MDATLDGLLTSPLVEDDFPWVCSLMNLQDLDSDRRKFLLSTDTLDVSACPGSGKTTLIVAKLALLVRRWASRTRGICVLSHTNVAKDEIMGRLGGSDVGSHAFEYPHYVDTIHGFVNRFLAMPWLLSTGISVAAIDDDVCTAVRRRSLGVSARWWRHSLSTTT